jgi:hypothetical protein
VSTTKPSARRLEYLLESGKLERYARETGSVPPHRAAVVAFPGPFPPARTDGRVARVRYLSETRIERATLWALKGGAA